MNTKTFKHRFQTGTGLIEVLVAILVLAVGMLGMSKLNALLIRDGGTANNRALAVSLAQEKLDDLRGFKWINAAASYGEDCGAGIFCYSEIATNAGGYENGSGALRFPTGSVTVGNTSFDRTWTVVNNPRFKLVKVTVNWTDQNGDATAILESAIWQDDASLLAFAPDGTASAPVGPKVAYTPKGVPDVVPIAIGDGTNRETSKPLPDVSSNGLSISTEFTSVNYDANGEQTQEDFYTLNCTCQFAANAAANPAAYYTYKDGELVVKYPETASDRVNKVNGVAVTSQGDSQDPLCNTCCADHHDSEDANASTAATALFDPVRPSGDYENNGDHKHYYYTNASQPNLGLTRVAPTSGNDYLEACRFLRVDGIFRIMQDWQLADVTVMPKDGYLVEGSTALSNYQTYVGNVVKAQAKTDGGTATAAPNKNVLAARDLSNRSVGPVQLLARGVYVDKVYSAPRTVNSSYYDGIVAGTTGLDKIPFNEVNLTLLASWASNATSVVTVTNEPILDITSSTSDYYGVYNRGRANVEPGNGGNANITAYVLPSNSGLTGGSTRATYAAAVDYDSGLSPSGTIVYSSEIGIDPHDHRAALRRTDFINIARTGSTTAGSRAVSGILELGNSSGDLSKVNVSSCTVASATGNSTTFTCTVSDTYEGTLTLGTSQTGGFLSGTSCVVTAGTTPFNCGNYSVYGPTIQIRGTCTGNRCADKALSMTASGTGATCTKDNSNPYCTVPLDPSTHVWSGTITLGGVPIPKMDIELSPKTADCTNDGTHIINSTNKGPADQVSLFNMCAKNN